MPLLAKPGDSEFNTMSAEMEVKIGPLYSPIQFPEGVDIRDYYVQIRVGMCMAHVPSLYFPPMVIDLVELDDQGP
jgi:hypothetical protein